MFLFILPIPAPVRIFIDRSYFSLSLLDSCVSLFFGVLSELKPLSTPGEPLSTPGEREESSDVLSFALGLFGS